jgi:4-alpha-glucanotransferase
VDYDSVAAAKRTMLELAYRKFLTEAYSGAEPHLQPETARAWSLEQFIQTEGTPLELYATFQTLEEERRLVQSKSVTWHDWPKQFLTPGLPVRECEAAPNAHSLLSIYPVGGKRTTERDPKDSRAAGDADRAVS